jgi:hypothetical protein
VDCTYTLVEYNSLFNSVNFYAIYIDSFANVHLQGDIQDHYVGVSLYSNFGNEIKYESESEFKII